MKKWAISAIVYLLVLIGGYSIYTNYIQPKNMDHNAGTGQKQNGHSIHGGVEETEKNDLTKLDFKFTETPQSGKKVTLTINVKDEEGKPVKDFELEHEKLMHLIVISKDLSFFDHIHPEYKGDGKFEIVPNFPSGGEYKLYADFVPKGESKIVKSSIVKVEGQEDQPTNLVADQKLTKVIDGKEITLTFDHLMTNMELPMTFKIKDAKTKKPITNLQPYLGAIGHVVAISGDTENYLHVHPMDENTTGPDAKFMTSFPKKGLYKIWGQFQHDGKVFIVPFTVNVPE
ncbi:hypothetical protein [Gottfriedia acidiceleris]|uniref:hypothetical protein n=1 Tax=Gottfriedia acidiceleris TaxID=371036 RepID=UPI002FFECA3B